MRPGNLNETQVNEQFEICFKQHFKALCLHALNFVKDVETAKDIVHDVFLTVWKHKDTLDFSQSLYPYLLSLTRNRSLNYLHHQKVVSRHEEQELLKDELYVATDSQEHEELIAKIMLRIAMLPERCSEVMYLYLVECKKYKEIAEICHISVNTVKGHISSGLKILREEFPPSLLLLLIHRLKKI